jgi:hypothetical protein
MHPLWHPLGCAQASFGALRGTGLGFDHTREANTLYVAAGLRGGVGVHLTRILVLRALVEGQVPLRPTRLETNGTAIWSTPPFAVAFVPMLAIEHL